MGKINPGGAKKGLTKLWYSLICDIEMIPEINPKINGTIIHIINSLFLFFKIKSPLHIIKNKKNYSQ